jgi:hypothetical protein
MKLDATPPPPPPLLSGGSGRALAFEPEAHDVAPFFYALGLDFNADPGLVDFPHRDFYHFPAENSHEIYYILSGTKKAAAKSASR